MYGELLQCSRPKSTVVYMISRMVNSVSKNLQRIGRLRFSPTVPQVLGSSRGRRLDESDVPPETTDNSSKNLLVGFASGNATMLLTFAVYSMLTGCMYGGGGNPPCPVFDPGDPRQRYSDWVREVNAWLTITAGRLPPSAQAATLQLSMRGVARRFAMQLPTAAINYGAEINGVATDPVTYLLYQIGCRYANTEEEASLRAGLALIDFRSVAGERIDDLFTRFDMARQEAASVGADQHSWHNLCTILFRSLHFGPNDFSESLRPFGGRYPNSQAQFSEMCDNILRSTHPPEFPG